MSLLRVPIEIISLIAQHLDPCDLLNLSLSGRHFRYLIRHHSVCQITLKNARYSVEYQEACATSNYAKGLRRLVKRQHAIQTARPFQVLKIVDDAIHFIYANRVLCYTAIQKGTANVPCLRILGLRGSVDQELVIDIPEFLKKAPMLDFHEDQPYLFKPLHYSHGIVSCLYRKTKESPLRNWLVVHGPDFVHTRALAATNDIFVRNNRDFLYFGTRSESRDDNVMRWALEGLNISTSKWLPQRMVLEEFIGDEMGSSICFEIFDGHLYGLSSQELADPGATRMSSFYYAFRFRLGHPSTTQVLPRSASWRRDSREGPIDDRWSSLELSRDEESGRIFIVEARREWPLSSSMSQRTCYKKELVFPLPHVPNRQNSRIQDPERDWDMAFHGAERTPDNLHHGDEGSSNTIFTFHNTPIRSYNASCRAFMDLVNHPPASDAMAKRLRLRIRPQLSRLHQTSGTGQSSPSQPHSSADAVGATRDHEIRMWPAEQDPELPDPALDHLYGILNPQGNFDQVDWAADERFVVYSTNLFNHEDEPRPIVLVSFDPALRFHRLCKWDDGPASTTTAEACCHTSRLQFGRASSSTGTAEAGLKLCPHRQTTSPGDAQTNRDQENMAAQSTTPSPPRWLRAEPARYMDDTKDGRPIGFDLSI